MKLKRNDQCPCGSGKKYKNCCYLDPAKNAEIVRAASAAISWEEMIELLSEPMKVYTLKVVLVRMGPQEIEEEISRTFKVGSNHTLYNLHMDIQNAFQWDNDHMFSFYLGGRLFDRENEYSGTPLGEHILPRIGPPNRLAAATQMRDLKLTENAIFLYLFDYGDELVHEIIVEQIRDANDQDETLPRIVNKVRTPPPQYG